MAEMEKTDKQKYQTRRSHTKSRQGCLSCKKRRVKCDELKPKCGHCCRLMFTCEYPKVQEEELRPKRILPLNLAAKTVQESEPSSNVSKGPVATLPPSHPSPYDLSPIELKLLHHYITMHENVNDGGGSVFSDLVPNAWVTLELSHSHEMVKHAIMYSAAAYLGTLTQSSDLQKESMKHQVVAYRDMRNAIASFSEETADAVFTSTSMMMWWAPDWRTWAALIKGIRAVTIAMRPMQKTSRFSALLARNIKEIDDHNAEEKLGHKLPSERDRARLKLLISYLRSAEPFVKEMSSLRNSYFELLLEFSLDTLHQPPGPTATEQFKRTFPLESKIVVLASQLVAETNIRDVNNLVLFSLYFSTIVAIKPFFHAVRYIYIRDMHRQGVVGMWQYLAYSLSLGEVGDGVSGERRREAVRITGLLAEFVKDEDPKAPGERAEPQDG